MAATDTVKTVQAAATGLEILLSLIKHPEFNGGIDSVAALTNAVITHQQPDVMAQAIVGIIQGFNIKL